MTPTIDLLTSHRSIRHFTDEPITEAQREAIINSARATSSSSFLQCSSIIRITDPAMREQLVALTGGQKHVAQAAEFWVFCADFNRHLQICPEAELGLAEQLLLGIRPYIRKFDSVNYLTSLPNGDVCLALARIPERLATLGVQDGLASLGDLQTLAARLRALPLVSDGRDGQALPLVLDDDRLYLARYHAFETQVADWLRQAIGHPDVRVLPNPVLPAVLPTDVPREAQTLLFLGRLEPEKGVFVLVEALARLTQLLRSHHSYEVPQITMRTERCLNDYAKWLKQQVQL